MDIEGMAEGITGRTAWTLKNIVIELLYGLVTDGGHHKQYSLETVLRMICHDDWVDMAKEELQWEDGIPS